MNFVSPPHRRTYASLSKPSPNKTFPHQQFFFPITSVTKSSTARFLHENLVEKLKIFVQDIVPIRTALRPTLTGTENLYENGPDPFFSFGTKNMARVKLTATILFRYGFDNYSKLVYAGEI